MSNTYPQATWRLLINQPLNGARNMAIDESILQALAQNQSQPTLRFYQWEPACLSLGFGQRAREVDEAALAQKGYSWVRRPTGGRGAVGAQVRQWHGQDHGGARTGGRGTRRGS